MFACTRKKERESVHVSVQVRGKWLRICKVQSLKLFTGFWFICLSQTNSFWLISSVHLWYHLIQVHKIFLRSWKKKPICSVGVVDINALPCMFIVVTSMSYECSYQCNYDCFKLYGLKSVKGIHLAFSAWSFSSLWISRFRQLYILCLSLSEVAA